MITNKTRLLRGRPSALPLLPHQASSSRVLTTWALNHDPAGSTSNNEDALVKLRDVILPAAVEVFSGWMRTNVLA